MSSDHIARAQLAELEKRIKELEEYVESKAEQKKEYSSIKDIILLDFENLKKEVEGLKAQIAVINKKLEELPAITPVPILNGDEKSVFEKDVTSIPKEFPETPEEIIDPL